MRLPNSLSFPQTREVPQDVLAGLREVDPRTSVLWWGPTLEVVEQPIPGYRGAVRVVNVIKPAWLIGIVDPLRVGHKVAAARCDMFAKASLAQGPTESAEQFRRRCYSFRQRHKLAALSYQGFVPKFFWFARDLDFELVDEYRAMAWFSEHLFETMVKKNLAELADDAEDLALSAKMDLMRKAVAAMMPDIWRHTFRGRRSFLVPQGRAA